MDNLYKELVFTDESSENWFYKRYYYSGSNCRYWTFQIALNLLAQKTNSPTIIETGCQRMKEDLGAGMSSSIFGEFCSRYSGKLYTIDITPQHIEICKTCTSKYSSFIEYICEDSAIALERLGKQGTKADLLYLDSVDFPIGDNAHDVNLRNLSQTHCVREFEIALATGLIKPETILLIDDNQLPYGGKPKLLKDKLINAKNWTCLIDSQQSLWVQK